LQTLITAATFSSGLEVAGVVLNRPSPADPTDESLATNRRELEARAVPTVLGELGFQAKVFDRSIDWAKVATAL
jgi:hypothetical protein